MSRRERYGTRDLAFSRWHRAIPRDDLTWIDIDHCAYCDDCKEPLYLMELARDVGQAFKATTVTRRLAQRLAIPALLVLYSADEQEQITGFRIQRVAPNFTEMASVEPQVLIDWIHKTRAEHVCIAATTRPSLKAA